MLKDIEKDTPPSDDPTTIGEGTRLFEQQVDAVKDRRRTIGDVFSINELKFMFLYVWHIQEKAEEHQKEEKREEEEMSLQGVAASIEMDTLSSDDLTTIKEGTRLFRWQLGRIREARRIQGDVARLIKEHQKKYTSICVAASSDCE